jgi:hypothetical protein
MFIVNPHIHWKASIKWQVPCSHLLYLSVGIFQSDMAKVAVETVTEEELEANWSTRARTLANWK